MSPAMPERPGGKPRSFGRGLLLIVVTLGLYVLYWHYKAYKELEDDFPDTVDFPLGLYLSTYIPIVNILTQILFMSSFISDVNKVRHRHDLPRGLTLGGFLAWYILGLMIIIGPFVAYYKLQTSINDIWKAAHQARGAQGEGQPSWTSGPAAPSDPQPSAAQKPAAEPYGDPAASTSDPRVSTSDPSPRQPEDGGPAATGSAASHEPASSDEESADPQPAAASPPDPTPTETPSEEAKDEVPASYEPHPCSTCGEETAVPPKRPLRLTCPECGAQQVLRNGN